MPSAASNNRVLFFATYDCKEIDRGGAGQCLFYSLDAELRRLQQTANGIPYDSDSYELLSQSERDRASQEVRVAVVNYTFQLLQRYLWHGEDWEYFDPDFLELMTGIITQIEFWFRDKLPSEGLIAEKVSHNHAFDGIRTKRREYHRTKVQMSFSTDELRSLFEYWRIHMLSSQEEGWNNGWGGQELLYAVSQVYRVNLSVYNPESSFLPGRPIYVTGSVYDTTSKQRDISVSYVDGCHFRQLLVGNGTSGKQRLDTLAESESRISAADLESQRRSRANQSLKRRPEAIRRATLRALLCEVVMD